MQVIALREPIPVLAAFRGGLVQPLRFQWQGQPYRVDQINGRWHVREGEFRNPHFSIQAAGDTWFLHFSTRDCQWWLDQRTSAD